MYCWNRWHCVWTGWISWVATTGSFSLELHSMELFHLSQCCHVFVLCGLCSRRAQECPLSENIRRFSGRGTYRTENLCRNHGITDVTQSLIHTQGIFKIMLYIVVKLMAYLLPRHLLCCCRTLVAHHRLGSTTIVLVNSVARARYSLFPIESAMHCCFLCRRYAKDAWQCYFTLHLTRSPVFVLCMSKL